MADEKLKPCPFCGGEAEIERYGNHRQSTQYRCTQCGCQLETGEEFNFGADWNNRPHSPTLTDGLAEENAQASVCREILSIMEEYDRQDASPHGVDTPGGLEHMGDVWRLLDTWRDTLKALGPSTPKDPTP